MLIMTTWKQRPLTPGQANRLMDVWGKVEAETAENPGVERLCWYVSVDGSCGVTVVRAVDPEAAAAYELATSLALGEFLEFDAKIVLDLDAAMPAILKGMEYVNG